MALSSFDTKLTILLRVALCDSCGRTPQIDKREQRVFLLDMLCKVAKALTGS